MMHAVEDIDWRRWTPAQRATLMFVVDGERVLLIHKKRGLGAGYINAPGGRIEDGETPRQAAVRETIEETGVTPLDVSEAGELFFQFVDSLTLHAVVFRAEGFTGSAHETDEAIPCWVPLGAIPYGRMWADDILWVPLLLERRRFRGYFVFDGRLMRDHRVEAEPS